MRILYGILAVMSVWFLGLVQGPMLGPMLGPVQGAVLVEVIGDGKGDNGIEDDRMPLITLGTGLLRQLKSVGVIRCDTVVVGTAVIVGVNPSSALILTAGHVVADKDAQQCQFFPYNMFRGYEYQIIRKPETVKDRQYEGDWALLQVQADLSVFGAMPFARDTQAVKKDRPAMLVAFDQGYNALAASQNDCLLLAKDKDGLAAHQPSVGLDSCDSGKGASGGALLVPSKSGKLFLYGLRTGFLSRVRDNGQGEQLSPKRGDQADVSHFANAHHRMTKVLRDQVNQALPLSAAKKK